MAQAVARDVACDVAMGHMTWHTTWLPHGIRGSPRLLRRAHAEQIALVIARSGFARLTVATGAKNLQLCVPEATRCRAGKDAQVSSQGNEGKALPWERHRCEQDGRSAPLLFAQTLPQTPATLQGNPPGQPFPSDVAKQQKGFI